MKTQNNISLFFKYAGPHKRAFFTLALVYAASVALLVLAPQAKGNGRGAHGDNRR